ncbi:non-classical arabinogalactan protein 30-like [Rutidosis leptorrhynchoides]|uniref:non-classical arabinogalactan protein 30-like n=1 Tax=Rutidosis leptorrhynchoides TaxID=125765 RepID=UPI003A9A4C42
MSSSRVLVSILLLTSFLFIHVNAKNMRILPVAYNTVFDVSLAMSPHHAPSYQPVAAPAPLHHHHHNHSHHHKKVSAPPPLSHAPAKPPVPSPAVKPPTISPAPVSAPIPARKLVAVQGVVYCKACKYKGIDTLLGATPLQGAEVLLTCNNTKYPLRVKGTTDKNGYFFIKPPKTLTTYGSHTCRVSLLTSPMATCNAPTDLHAGVKGSLLVPSRRPPSSSPDTKPLPYDVFSVGPFAFEASSKTPCA